MEYVFGGSFSFDSKLYWITFGWKSKGRLSAGSYSIHFEQKWKPILASVTQLQVVWLPSNFKGKLEVRSIETSTSFFIGWLRVYRVIIRDISWRCCCVNNLMLLLHHLSMLIIFNKCFPDLQYIPLASRVITMSVSCLGHCNKCGMSWSLQWMRQVRRVHLPRHYVIFINVCITFPSSVLRL